jgi:hypothetical protein
MLGSTGGEVIRSTRMAASGLDGSPSDAQVSMRHERLRTLGASNSGEVVTAEEAVQLIRDDDTVTTSGFVGIGSPGEIALALKVALPVKARRAT